MKKIAPFFALLLILALIVPVFAQDPDVSRPDVSGIAVSAPLAPESVVTVDKADLQARATEDLGVVSVIVVFDESVSAQSLETATGGKVVNRYNRVFNGASLLVSEGSVEALASLPGVKAVYPDEELHIDTEVSPEFIGAPDIWAELGRGLTPGEGVVVGVLDTGIWPEHPSFSDPDPSGRPYPAPPGGPYGCDFGDVGWNPNDAPFTCNNKLIGAYEFRDTYKAVYGLSPDEFDSARDADGHGSHTTSTAAGNGGVDASIFGVPRGTISGVAPRAHVIMYAVCAGESGSCFVSDSVAAAEQALIDGVDVINFSIGGGSNPYSDAVSQAFLALYEAGTTVSCSAGNSGPGSDTVGHREPWTITVGASTSDRHFLTTVMLRAVNGDRLDLIGATVTPGIDTPTRVVLAADAGDAQCLNPFPPGTWTGEIVVCERGVIARVAKSFNVAEGGAGGLLLYNPSPQGLNTDNHFIPSVHLDYDEGQDLLGFMADHAQVFAIFDQGVATFVQGDVMAGFSSRGGPAQTLGISKPDITAPGVQILAGHTPMPAWVPGGLPGEMFWSIQGTSMSSPHIAGAAALLKDLNPGWSPGQIKSALMMTAKTQGVVKEDGMTPADPFDYGSGRVDLTKAGHPSLTISDTGASFMAHEGDLWNANYPSLYLPFMPGQMTVERTLHNELPYRRVWRTVVSSPPDVKVKVNKYIAVPGGGDKTINITVDARDVPLGEVRHAEIRFRRYNEVLRFPITIVRRQPVVSLDKVCDPALFDLGDTTECTITIENTSFEEANVSLVDELPNRLELIPESVVGGVAVDNMVTFDGALYPAAAPEVYVDYPAPWGNGYASLAGMGAPPNVTMGDEECVNFSTDSFLYAGETWDSIGMVSNGYAVVGGCTGDDDISYINDYLPSAGPPNNVLAPFWTDLDPSSGGNYYAYYLTDGVYTWLVFEWEDAPTWSGDEINTFQLWVGVSGFEDISFAYGPVLGDGDVWTPGEAGFLTVGAENEFGNSGQMHYFSDGDGSVEGTLPVALDDDVIVYSAPGAPGETHVITFEATGVEDGGWQNCAEMTSDLYQGMNIMCFNGEVYP